MTPVTTEQKVLIERFRTAFNSAENHLRHVLNEPPETSMRRLINEYGSSRPRWRNNDGRRLEMMTSLRNAIVHTRQRPDEYLSVPVPAIVDEIEAICKRLTSPATAIPTFQRKVAQFAATDTLGTVLERIASDNFSQFPVYGGSGEFCGLLTENGITRWLAKHINDNGLTLVEFEDACIEDVLRAEEERDNWLFVARTTPVPDVAEEFVLKPFLEAVLITQEGKKDEELLGIATRWDIPQHLAGGNS